MDGFAGASSAGDFFAMILQVLLAIILISVLIIVHEAGHFLAARYFGVKVFEFSVGFGKVLWKGFSRGTQFSLRMIPLGGFVRLAGMEKPQEEESFQRDESFDNLRFFPKLLVLASGSFFNMIFAFLLLVFAYTFLGFPDGLGTKIGHVLPHTPASTMSLRKGDSILALNHRPVQDGATIVKAIRSSEGKKIVLRIQRDDREFDVWLYPILHPKEKKTYYVGFRLMPSVWHRDGFLMGVTKSVKEVAGVTSMTLLALVKLVTGKVGLAQLSGPIGIVSFTGEMVNYGAPFVARFMAMISINLAVLNLLPLPALDGGRMFVLSLGKAMGVRFKDENRFHYAGAVFLVVLMIVATYFDMKRILMR